MSGAIRNIIHDFVPPVAGRLWHNLKTNRRNTIWFEGPFKSWDDATRVSTGYDADVILQRVKESVLKVRSGQAVFERDSVVFDTPEYPFPVIASMLRAATANAGMLSVLDFGGSLGSTYFQCREFFRELRAVKWSIVEQQQFVHCGQQLLQDDILRFYESIEECFRQERPTVVLLSSVLQYLPRPWEILQEIRRRNVSYVIIDQLPVHDLRDERVVVQHVPESIYSASYPFRIFPRGGVEQVFAGAYRSPIEFDTVRFPELEQQCKARYAGMLFVRSDIHSAS